MTDLDPSRRKVLTGLAAGGVALPLLAACGASTTDSTGSTPSDPTTSASAGGSSTGGSAAAAGGIKTADIPVGGGKIFASQKVVVTQPAAGEFKAFSAVCTHQGCLLSQVKDGTIDCSSCHGSEFSIEDGSVKRGPATKGLPAKSVAVTGDTLTVS